VSDPALYARGLHRYATAVAVATGVLLFVGGLVTSTGSGLAVPDWPLSFGKLFPKMTGGVLFEHGHRLVAGTVALLTVVLAIVLARAEPRRWVRRLGLAAVAAVIIQAVLGGLTVLLKLPVALAVAHAGVAEIFFCLTATIALVTSRSWLAAEAPMSDAGRPRLRTLSVVTAAAVYLQVLVGALVRHTGAGLAIPDFPLSFGRLVPEAFPALVLYHFAHRVGALAVTVCVVWLVAAILRRHRDRPALTRPALILIGLLGWQIFLGAAIVWTRRAVVPTTTHVLSGALVLVTTVIIALRAHCELVPAAPARSPAVPEPAHSTAQAAAA